MNLPLPSTTVVKRAVARWPALLLCAAPCGRHRRWPHGGPELDHLVQRTPKGNPALAAAHVTLVAALVIESPPEAFVDTRSTVG